MTILAHHGTDRLDFTRFDIAAARPFNIGLHFGTKSAAESRIDYLRGQDAAASFRILTCRLTLENPFRIDDVFGHSYGMLLEALDSEINRQNAPAALRQRFDRLSARWMSVDDNPRFQKDPSLYAAFNARMNVSIRRLFQALGYYRLVDETEYDSYEGAA